MAPNPENLQAIRHQLHALAELSGQEETTAQFIAEHLARCHPTQLVTGLGGHGVVACFTGQEPGPTILLRAELDALPIAETLALDHASFSGGVAHKCGHDGHMAMLLGVGARLRQNPLTKGRVLLLFQPAEETGNGAAAVVADPRFATFTPDWVFALHNLPGYPLHAILVAPGPFCAASVGLKITLTGKTSHAAYPEAGISPDRAMANLVLDLVNLPDRLSAEPGSTLVTIVHSHLGKPSFGVAPGQAIILATLRANNNETLGRLKDAANNQVSRIATAEKLEWATTFQDEFPAVVNEPAAVALVELAAEKLGLALSPPQESPFRWSEDCGHLMALGQGAMIGLGCGPNHPVLHAEDYDFNDALLPTGVNLLTAICRHLTSQNQD